MDLGLVKMQTWPNLDQQTPGKLERQEAPKSQFVGSGPFSEGSYRSQTQFFENVKNTTADMDLGLVKMET